MNSDNSNFVIPDSFEIVGTVHLYSDGPEGIETYELIRSKFGPGSLELPDLYQNNHPGFKHVQEDSDTIVGNFFAFYMHREIDRDRDKYPNISDRQRNEIKGYDGSVSTMKGLDGEWMYLKWKFRVNDSMTISKNFCHFFQLKGVGGDDANPIITLSASLSGSTQEFKIIHSPEAGYTKLAINNNYPIIRGKWLEVECLVQFSDTGYFKLSVKDFTDGTEYLSFEKNGIDMIREGNSFVRPKWGIYRSIATKEYIQNEEDVVYFSDFEVNKLIKKASTVGAEKRQEVSIIQCYPNPATENLNCRFTLGLETEYRLFLYDATGRIVFSGITGKSYHGEHEEVISLKGMGPGLYFLHLDASDYSEIKKLIIE